MKQIGVLAALLLANIATADPLAEQPSWVMDSAANLDVYVQQQQEQILAAQAAKLETLVEAQVQDSLAKLMQEIFNDDSDTVLSQVTATVQESSHRNRTRVAVSSLHATSRMHSH